MGSETSFDQLSVSVEGGDVLLQTPGGADRRLPPDMTDRLPQQLVESAEKARNGAGA